MLVVSKFLIRVICNHPFFRELRDKPSTMISVNICICLIGVYFFYMVGVGRTSHYQSCNALTFFLHYFTLACFKWMSVNAYQMYRAFTSVRENDESCSTINATNCFLYISSAPAYHKKTTKKAQIIVEASKWFLNHLFENLSNNAAKNCIDFY